MISTAMDKTSLLLPRGEMMTTLSKLLSLGFRSISWSSG